MASENGFIQVRESGLLKRMRALGTSSMYGQANHVFFFFTSPRVQFYRANSPKMYI